MLDDDLCREIAHICEEHGVGLCYVFGSQARGDEPDELADLDLGVLPRGWPEQSSTLDEWLALQARIAPLIAPRPLDLVQLDKVGCQLQHEAITDGRLIHAVDCELRVEFEDRVVRDWLDFAWVMAANYRDMRAEALGEESEGGNGP